LRVISTRTGLAVLLLLALAAPAAHAYLRASAGEESSLSRVPARGSAAEARAMVQKAVAAIRTNGADAVIAAVNRHDPRFVDRDLYLVIYDMQGHALAHLNPRMVGKDLLMLRDADGKLFIRERIDIASKQGSGWQDYKFLNPLSQQIEPKSMYLERHEQFIIGCGIYK
jgi:cytochrome c